MKMIKYMFFAACVGVVHFSCVEAKIDRKMVAGFLSGIEGGCLLDGRFASEIFNEENLLFLNNEIETHFCVGAMRLRRERSKAWIEKLLKTFIEKVLGVRALNEAQQALFDTSCRYVGLRNEKTSKDQDEANIVKIIQGFFINHWRSQGQLESRYYADIFDAVSEHKSWLIVKNAITLFPVELDRVLDALVKKYPSARVYAGQVRSFIESFMMDITADSRWPHPDCSYQDCEDALGNVLDVLSGKHGAAVYAFSSVLACLTKKLVENGCIEDSCGVLADD
ncbi:hypothetical protein K2W90_06380 [Candidatus Babeliales bacterium]|nr:hypothetical protein [Candidatus Babeliales bacterium]